MPEIIMYSTGYCPYCARARELFNAKHVAFYEIRVDLEPHLRAEMTVKSGKNTVPQIFINGHYVGGCDDLYALEAQGTLDQLLRG